jgi:hypothetical protein
MMATFIKTIITLLISFCFAQISLAQEKAETKEKELDDAVVGESVKQFDQKLIPAKVRQHIFDIRECYVKELKKDNKLAGKLKVNFYITEKGTTSNITITSLDIKNKIMEECIIGIFSSLSFPPNPDGDTEYSYPFEFNRDLSETQDQDLKKEPEKKQPEPIIEEKDLKKDLKKEPETKQSEPVIEEKNIKQESNKGKKK